MYSGAPSQAKKCKLKRGYSIKSFEKFEATRTLPPKSYFHDNKHTFHGPTLPQALRGNTTYIDSRKNRKFCVDAFKSKRIVLYVY